MVRLSTQLKRLKQQAAQKSKMRNAVHSPAEDDAEQSTQAALLSKLTLHVAAGEGLRCLREWFSCCGFEPFAFQEEAWAHYRAGENGLINVPTGAGKTYAAYLGPLSELLEEPGDGLKILIVTPLRALSRDMEKSLEAPIKALQLPFRVESRTGDTTSAVRSRQAKRLPHILITTPESLNLLLSHAEARERFAGLRCVIVDEWHELMTTKRGIQVELALSRLRAFSPLLRTWALSATMPNLTEAAQAVVGLNERIHIIQAEMSRPVIVESLIPPKIEGFPWAGHLGSQMLEPLLNALDINVSTLIFTNVRSHAERWYQDILESRPEWAGLMALHHGSLSQQQREFVEEGLKEGFIKLVICTSSLDLGVDFAPVERVFQIGSPKGVARIIQRAGRAAHRPGLPCKITCVPTQSLELLEISAVRQAIRDNALEPRLPLEKPYDVLLQHIMTCALGGGFTADSLYAEVKTTLAYQNLHREAFDWALAFLSQEDSLLAAYAHYRKLVCTHGIYTVPDARIAQLHRFNIGTISAETTMRVAFLKGKPLGQIEESFVSRLKPGDIFTFAGRTVEFVSTRDMTAYVRLSQRKTNVIPRWSGGRLPLTSALALYFRQALAKKDKTFKAEPEIKALQPVLALQKERSVLPGAGQLLAESFQSKQGHHLFLYPFEGRLVHEGIALLMAYRMSQHQKLTVQMTVNDYGIEFLSRDAVPYQQFLTEGDLFSTDQLVSDLINSVNLSELARRQFRDIARISGLIYQNYPGTLKNSRQLHTSASVLFDVFEKFEPDNLLLAQARQEVLVKQFDRNRLFETLQRLQSASLIWVDLKKPTPLCFPLMVERIGNQQVRVSNESLAERIRKMQEEWLK